MDQNASYEELFQELEEIVKKLEGSLPLQEAIQAFERGIYLKKLCEEKLAQAQGKLEAIMAADTLAPETQAS